MDKNQLRKDLKALRNSFSQDIVSVSSMLIEKHILSSELYQRSACIMGYLAFGQEISVDGVLQQALKDGKTVCVPYIVSASEMVPVQIKTFSDFVLDRYKIRSVSNAADKINAEQIDLALVPGVAFDPDGNRLGMGAGYYDRFLAQAIAARRIGVVYRELMQKKLPHMEYDLPMEYIVNEDGMFTAGGSSKNKGA